MNITIITQARTGSTRLPNKVLKKINDETLLEIHLKRISQSTKATNIIVATTVKKEDDLIENEAKRLQLNFSRGSEDDVLDRFYQAVKNEKPNYVVRVTSDCPLLDPELVDKVIDFTIKNKVDYCTNCATETFPDGQDIEVFTFSALETAWKNAKLLSEREHVTPYIRNNKQFTKIDYPSPFPQYKDVRLTVDEPNDFEVITKVIHELGTDKKWNEYAQLYIENEAIHSLNSSTIRNEGYLKSLQKD